MVDSVSTSALSLFQGQTALTLLSGSSGTADSDAILSAYQAQFEASSSSFGAAVQTTPAHRALEFVQRHARCGQRRAGRRQRPGFHRFRFGQLDAPAGVSTQDYKNLFALYQGLNTPSTPSTTWPRPPPRREPPAPIPPWPTFSRPRSRRPSPRA
ncbi:MAG: hypothetical protein WDN45_18870 [Caulobacteraceae bacterium]